MSKELLVSTSSDRPCGLSSSWFSSEILALSVRRLLLSALTLVVASGSPAFTARYSARFGSLIWRPLAAGAAMALALYAVCESSIAWQIVGAVLSLLIYGVGRLLSEPSPTKRFNRRAKELPSFLRL